MTPTPPRALVGLLAAALTLTGLACSPPEYSVLGTWHATLESPGGPLHFTLEIIEREAELVGAVVNGEERAPLSAVVFDGLEVRLEFDWYDSEIRATMDRDGMAGEWSKVVPEGFSRLPFRAVRAVGDAGADGDARDGRPAADSRGASRRFAPLAESGLEPGSDVLDDVSGTWAVVFTDDDGSEPAQGEFTQQGERVRGTFLTPTGDYRFLDGSFERGVLRLSTFDGAHAFLFHARVTPEATLEGDFWSRDTYHATWTARRVESNADPAAAEPLLPDAWELVGLTNDDGLLRFEFPDLEGNPVSLADARFDGKVVAVVIFGSWCPNCNDEAPLLAEWHRRYGERGLEIVGLAYEFTGDPERDRRQVRRYAERYGIEFPLLLAGVSDKAEAAETLPDITAVIAYPTTIFVGRDGRVRKIHTGFAGPGTGEHHTRLVEELEGTMEELLAEPA